MSFLGLFWVAPYLGSPGEPTCLNVEGVMRIHILMRDFARNNVVLALIVTILSLYHILIWQHNEQK